MEPTTEDTKTSATSKLVQETTSDYQVVPGHIPHSLPLGPDWIMAALSQKPASQTCQKWWNCRCVTCRLCMRKHTHTCINIYLYIYIHICICIMMHTICIHAYIYRLSVMGYRFTYRHSYPYDFRSLTLYYGYHYYVPMMSISVSPTISVWYPYCIPVISL